MQTLRRTPLHAAMSRSGARMVPFAGWEMPVQYEGVIPEHRAVRDGLRASSTSRTWARSRSKARRARELLQRCSPTTSTASSDGRAQYTLLTNERGGIVDDLIVYRLDAAPLPARRQRGEPRAGASRG